MCPNMSGLGHLNLELEKQVHNLRTIIWVITKQTNRKTLLEIRSSSLGRQTSLISVVLL